MTFKRGKTNNYFINLRHLYQNQVICHCVSFYYRICYLIGTSTTTYHLREGHQVGRDRDCLELLDTKVLVVEGLGEVIRVIDKEAPVVDCDGVADHDVAGSEVFLDLLSSEFHDYTGEGGLDIISI